MQIISLDITNNLNILNKWFLISTSIDGIKNVVWAYDETVEEEYGTTLDA